MKKEKYVSPEIEIIKFVTEDILMDGSVVAYNVLEPGIELESVKRWINLALEKEKNVKFKMVSLT